MKVLVTAGSTGVMIDKVRMITNIFKGKTGHAIAEYFYDQGEDVTLLTSNKDLETKVTKRIHYKLYDELYDNMALIIPIENYDLIIHSAAVSDYKPDGVYVMQPNLISSELIQLDSSSKVGSEHETLYLKMIQTRKIIDDIRPLWNHESGLIKFKLQVDMLDEELIDVATNSMNYSCAEMIVANCLEWSRERAYIIEQLVNNEIKTTNVQRQELAKTIYDKWIQKIKE